MVFSSSLRQALGLGLHLCDTLGNFCLGKLNGVQSKVDCPTAPGDGVLELSLLPADWCVDRLQEDDDERQRGRGLWPP